MRVQDSSIQVVFVAVLVALGIGFVIANKREAAQFPRESVASTPVQHPPDRPAPLIRSNQDLQPERPLQPPLMLEPRSFQTRVESHDEAWRDVTNRLFEVSLATTPDEAIVRLLDAVFDDSAKEQAQATDLVVLKIDLPAELLAAGLEKTISREISKSIPQKPIVKRVDSDSEAMPKNALVIRVEFQPTRNSAIASANSNGDAEVGSSVGVVVDTQADTPPAVATDEVIPMIVASEGDSKPNDSGMLTLTIEGLNEPVVNSMSFVNKPWVHGFDAFASEYPGEYLMLARSALNTTESATHSQAIENAAQSISQAIIQARYTGLNHMWRHIHDMTRQRLLAGDLTKDRFVQELKRPYGSVWREALLIRLEPDDLTDLMNQHQRFAVEYRHRSMSAAASVFVVLATSVLLFWVLNLWTKGYHKGKITMSLILLGGAGLVVIYWALASCSLRNCPEKVSRFVRRTEFVSGQFLNCR